MTDEHSIEPDDVDDPLARIRARFEQASERILSATDDLDLPLPEPAPLRSVPAPAAPAAGSVVGIDPLEDFGEIDIQDDARFSLDFEHGVSDTTAGAQAAPSRSTSHFLDETVDLVANLAIVREDAPDLARSDVDPERHAKHRTRGRVDLMIPEVDEVEELPEPADAEPEEEPARVRKDKKAKKTKKSRESKKETPEEAAPPPAVTTPAAEETAETPPSRRGLAFLAVALLAAGGVAGYFLLASSPSDTTPATTAAETTTTIRQPATPSEAAAIALDAFGFTDLQVGVDETGVATIVGTVRTARERDIAIEIVTEIDGVVEVVTDIVYDTNRAPSAVRADIDELALTVNHALTYQYADGIVVVSGIVPETAVESGELGSGGTFEGKLLDIAGIEEVRFDLTLQGNPLRLASQITQLLTTGPVLYDEETGERLAESNATLDAIAALMAEEPGLTIEIAVRGDDVEDEELLLIAEQRREEIVAYLVAAGVDPGLIDTVLVATLEPTTQDLPGEVLIEVVDP